jgi:hypothetical protein
MLCGPFLLVAAVASVVGVAVVVVVRISIVSTVPTAHVAGVDWVEVDGAGHSGIGAYSCCPSSTSSFARSSSNISTVGSYLWKVSRNQSKIASPYGVRNVDTNLGLNMNNISFIL